MLAAARPAAAQASGPVLPRLVFDAAGEAVRVAPPDGVAVALRHVVDAAGSGLAVPTVDAPRWPAWLTLRGVDDPAVDAATWAARVGSLLAAHPALAAVELQASGDDPRRAAFLLKMAAAEVRARDPGSLVEEALGAEPRPERVRHD